MEEVWKDIPWYEWKYQVNNLWKVRSLYHRSKKRIKLLSLCADWDWYLMAHLYDKWKHKYYKVHKAVMDTFIWKSLLQVNHINWIKDDNRLENLEYCTAKENIIHRFSILWHHWAYKRVSQFTILGKLINTYSSYIEAMKITWVDKSYISANVCWRQKTAWGFIWKHQ